MAIADMIGNFSQDDGMKIISELVTQIMEIDDAQINEQSIKMIGGAINGAITEDVRNQSIRSIIKDFEDENLSKAEARNAATSFRNDTIEILSKELQMSALKKQLLNTIFEPFYDMFDEAVARYRNYNIELPIMLDEGAKMPTYAHEEDACADVYALQDTIVPAHSLSNKIHTGLHFGTPEGWEIGLLPRSSIGAKTGLRLSNSRGVIDQTYRDELMVLYDNISDSDYTIKAGDRIAQMYVKPTYRFKAKIVSSLDDMEDRGGGLGSTGK